MQATTFRRFSDRLAARSLAETVIEARSRTFEQRLEALKRFDRALSRIGRHVAETKGDPLMQSFWRGVERDYETEAHRLALRVGAEATRLARIDF